MKSTFFFKFEVSVILLSRRTVLISAVLPTPTPSALVPWNVNFSCVVFILIPKINAIHIQDQEI